MLTAKLKNGNKLCLGYPYKKETLLSLRMREEFFCPVCGGKVILKLGDSRIYHFAHLKEGSCRDFYENETEYHMKGKLMLFQWLNRQKIASFLEYFDREIQQRPDILFHYQNQKYALEYQCSTLSEQNFRQRTEVYLASGYIPLWIIGMKQHDRNSGPSERLTNFHYLFLRTTQSGQLYIPSFSPDQGTLQLFSSIFPYSANKAFFHKKIIPIDQRNLSCLLDPSLSTELNIDYWKNAIGKAKLFWSLKPNSQKKKFLYEIYDHHLNLALLPPEIGLPLPHGLMIQTPPFVWQTYYYLDLLKDKHPGDLITIQEMKRCLAKRMKRNEILARNLPQSKKQDPLFAFADYTFLLAELGILIRGNKEYFQVQKQLKIPLTNCEQEERFTSFYRQNRKILINSK